MAITELLSSTNDIQENITDILAAETEVIDIQDLRKEYAAQLQKEPLKDTVRAQEVLDSNPDQPLFHRYELHPEDLPKRNQLIEMLTDTDMDITAVDHKIIASANNYAQLISDTIDRMNAIKERLNRDKQRLEDINFITSAYKGIGNIIPIVKDNFTGSCTYINETYSAATTEQKEAAFTVLSVSGNGYVGNAHVLDSNNDYQSLSENRGLITNLSDNSSLTVFEYSRICSRDVQKYQGTQIQNEIYDVNYDDRDAVCTISLKSDDGNINMLELDTDLKEIRIQDLLISDDGIHYASALEDEIDFSTDLYHSMNYIAGSSIISFPESSYIKLVLSSSYASETEKLGYDYTDPFGEEPETIIRPIENAVRKVIRLNGIHAFYCKYTESTIRT